MLGARTDGGQNLMRISGGEHENDVGWRLLQCLQKSRGGRLGQLVYFVEDVDLPTSRAFRARRQK